MYSVGGALDPRCRVLRTALCALFCMATWLDLPRELREYIYFQRHRLGWGKVMHELWRRRFGWDGDRKSWYFSRLHGRRHRMIQIDAGIWKDYPDLYSRLSYPKTTYLAAQFQCRACGLWRTYNYQERHTMCKACLEQYRH